MASKGSVLGFLAWFTGVIVSLVVGNAMINEALALPAWLGGTSTAGIFITVVIGWVIVITTLISAVLALLNK